MPVVRAQVGGAAAMGAAAGRGRGSGALAAVGSMAHEGIGRSCGAACSRGLAVGVDRVQPTPLGEPRIVSRAMHAWNHLRFAQTSPSYTASCEPPSPLRVDAAYGKRRAHQGPLPHNLKNGQHNEHA